MDGVPTWLLAVAAIVVIVVWNRSHGGGQLGGSGIASTPAAPTYQAQPFYPTPTPPGLNHANEAGLGAHPDVDTGAGWPSALGGGIAGSIPLTQGSSVPPGYSFRGTPPGVAGAPPAALTMVSGVAGSTGPALSSRHGVGAF